MGSPRPSGRTREDLAEPLAESARLAWDEAPARCYRDPRTGDTCLYYHRVWQYLRLLDVIRTIRTNSGFLVSSFGDYARTGRYRRVLVSATADYSMVAHLHAAYAEPGGLDVTVVDQCGTSLLLNRWYAERHSIPLATVAGDILEYAVERPFDLICTHNFLGRFDAPSRRRLVARWRSLLRPGGVVVTTQRVRPDSGDVYVQYTPGEARELSERVAAAARARSPRLDVDPDALAHATFEYAIRKRGHVIRTAGEITGLFEDEGFDVELADTGGGASERAQDRPSSTAGPDTYRMRLVARRR